MISTDLESKLDASHIYRHNQENKSKKEVLHLLLPPPTPLPPPLHSHSQVCLQDQLTL